MDNFIYINACKTTLAEDITESQATLSVSNPGRFPSSIPLDQILVLTLHPDGLPSTQEIVHCTAISGDVLTVVRGAQSTAAVAWPEGTVVGAYLTADMLDQIADDVRGHAGSGGSAHALATTVAAGFMSAANLVKLNGIQAGATNYQHPITHSPTIIAQDPNNRFVTDAEKNTWNAIADPNNLFVTDEEKALWSIPVYDARRGYNYIINGNFDIWQRGTSQTTSGYGSDDRWINNNVGSTKTHSRRAFGTGGVFSDGTLTPNFFSRTIVSSVTGASNICVKQSKLEDVTLLAGRKVTLAFYARADAPRSISVEFGQIFGTGGSPSENVLGIGVEKISLTNTFQRYVIKCELPSVLGKVLGTDNNSATQIYFWFDAGSNFNARTDSLGHQSGTFDIACVSLVEGDVDIKPIPRSIGEELALCQRYYATGRAHTRSYATTANIVFDTPVYFPVQMRAVPMTTITGDGGRANVTEVFLHTGASNASARHEIRAAGVGDCRAIADIWTADAEL